MRKNLPLGRKHQQHVSNLANSEYLSLRVAEPFSTSRYQMSSQIEIFSSSSAQEL